MNTIHYGISDNIGIFNLCGTINEGYTRDRDKVTCDKCLKLIVNLRS